MTKKPIYDNKGLKIVLKERRCLKCDKKFMSESKFNRMCLECRKVSNSSVDIHKMGLK